MGPRARTRIHIEGADRVDWEGGSVGDPKRARSRIVLTNCPKGHIRGLKGNFQICMPNEKGDLVIKARNADYEWGSE